MPAPRFGHAAMLAAFFSAFLASAALSEAWPQFRGPNGSATATGQKLPLQWSPANVLWKAKMQGVGGSSPIIWNERIFVTSANDGGERRVLACLDAAKGTTQWTRDWAIPAHKKHNKNTFATATPTTDGERVYACFTAPDRFLVVAVGCDGRPIWERELGGFASQHGSGASPIVYRDLLIVTNEQDGPSFVAALDKKTGEIRWKTPRRTEIVAYATPVVAPSPRGDQIVVASKAGLAGLDPADGKEIWTCDLFNARVVASPVLAEGLVVAQCGSGSKGERMVAVRTDGSGDVALTHVAWQETRMLPYCVTPVAHGPYLFLINDSPPLARCLEAKTGKELWTERLEGNFFASPVCVDGALFAVAEKGTVFVLAAEPRYRLLAKNHLDDFFVATPAVADGRMILRGEQFVWCIGNP